MNKKIRDKQKIFNKGIKKLVWYNYLFRIKFTQAMGLGFAIVGPIVCLILLISGSLNWTGFIISTITLIVLGAVLWGIAWIFTPFKET
jgi:hypothetical protein